MEDSERKRIEALAKKILNDRKSGKRKRAVITRVGFIINGEPENWGFDCMMEVPAIEITADGEMLMAGYSIQELKAISDEFYEK